MKRLLFCLLAWIVASATPRALAAEPTVDQQVLGFLDQTVDWYRRAAALDTASLRPQEAPFRDAVNRSAPQVLRLGFEYGRARAEMQLATAPPTPPATATTNPSAAAAAATAGGQGRDQRLAQSASAAAQKVTELQQRLDAVGRELSAADTSEEVTTLLARRGELAAQIDLATARRDVLQRLLASPSEVQGAAAGTLLEKVESLRRAVPEVQAAATNTAAAATPAKANDPPATAPPFRPESAGIYQLVSEMFAVSARRAELGELAERAERLKATADALRTPLRTQLMDALRRADAAAASTQPTDPAQLDARRQELEAMTQRFRQLSAAAIPLAEQGAFVDAARATLGEWRTSLEREHRATLRHLLFRVVASAVVILAVVGVAMLWKRAVFRYVHDARRRRQFMLVRRIVIACLIVIVTLFSLVTEFGGLATYAGILTAGIAVSLQTVILSAVAYFFYIGRYGVRVGDRVTVGAVTGEVIDTGLFRLYLMELGGGRAQRPTGRIVVFSNSVLFQPGGFFKQVPGTDYAWHELALTLAPDSDYRKAEERLMAAVRRVYETYRPSLERQHDAAVRSTAAAHLDTPAPEGRLRLVDAGLEFVVRYPVESRRAAETDDRLTRELLDEIGKEPQLKLVATATPKIQAAG